MPLPLPNGETQFIDASGNPLAGGYVYHYVPGTSTPKNTYQDQAGTIVNSNPVVLDAAGRAVIFGDGLYRQVVTDSAGNQQWDRETAVATLSVLGAVAKAGVSCGVSTPVNTTLSAILLGLTDGSIPLTEYENDVEKLLKQIG